MNKINFNKIVFILLMLSYRLSIDLAYIYIISPMYSYAGLVLDISHLKLVESYFLLIAISLILKYKISKPSEFFILFLFSVLVPPLLSVFSLQDKSRVFMYMVLFCFLVMIAVSKIPQVKIPLVPNGRIIAIITSTLMGILLFSWIILNGGINYINFNLLNVYESRSIVAELIFPGRLAYFMGWYGKVMNPFLIAFSLYRKNIMMLAATIGAQTLFFAVTGHKSMLFFPALILFVYMFSQKRYFGLMIPFGLAMVTLLSSIYYCITKNILLVSLFIRRVLFVTANNHYRYFDTFQELGLIYYSNKKWFPKLIEYPFDFPIPQVISLIYYGDTDTWVNTGFLATGYINFGFLGMLIYSVIVGIIFRFIDYLAKRHMPIWFCIAIMIAPIFSLLSADLPTTLVTHGILPAIMMLWLMSSNPDKDKLRIEN